MTDLPPARQTANAANAFDVAALASRLSLAQRNTVLNLGWTDNARPVVINRIVRRALLGAGLLQPIGKPSDNEYELTTLGTAVRVQILKDQEEC